MASDFEPRLMTMAVKTGAKSLVARPIKRPGETVPQNKGNYDSKSIGATKAIEQDR